ncbi:MAG TPA: hypothetical protein VGJ77_01165 [Gaiellaceae bacterium]
MGSNLLFLSGEVRLDAELPSDLGRARPITGEQAADTAGWASAMLELQRGHNTNEALVEVLTLVSQGARERLSRVERLRKAVGHAARGAGTLSVGWGDVSVTYDPSADDSEKDLSRTLFEVVEMAVDKGRDGFVLLLDEAQVVRDERTREGEHPLSLLISAVVALQRRELPVGLVLCGLPTLTTNLLRARSYTERMFRGEGIGSLDPAEAREAFTAPLVESGGSITATEDLVDRVIRDVEGYPYFIQLWGAELWDAADVADATELTSALLDAASATSTDDWTSTSTSLASQRSHRQSRIFCSPRPAQAIRRSSSRS